MSNTFTQIHIQAVFAVKYRQALITRVFQEELHKYITGIVQKCGHKMLAVNSMDDHFHMFFGFRPTQSLSDLMQLVKGESSEWINQKKLTPIKFNWQSGYGAFSYMKRDVPMICEYIHNQPLHHKKITFLDEYRSMLKEFEILFDERYIFSAPI